MMIEDNGANVEAGFEEVRQADELSSDDQQAVEANKIEQEAACESDGDTNACAAVCEEGDVDASSEEETKEVEVEYYTTDAICSFLKEIDTEGLYWYISDMARTPVQLVPEGADPEDESVIRTQLYLSSLKLNIVPGCNVKLGWEVLEDKIIPLAKEEPTAMEEQTAE